MAKHSTTVGIDVSQDALDIWVHPVGESWRMDYRTEHLRELVETLLGWSPTVIVGGHRRTGAANHRRSVHCWAVGGGGQSTPASGLRWTLRIFGRYRRGRLGVDDRGTREFLNVWGNCGW